MTEQEYTNDGSLQYAGAHHKFKTPNVTRAMCYTAGYEWIIRFTGNVAQKATLLQASRSVSLQQGSKYRTFYTFFHVVSQVGGRRDKFREKFQSLKMDSTPVL
jgi:ribosomal protein L31